MERLDKALSGTGRWSRREVKELVRRGRVLLDGVPAASPEQKIDPETADIRVDGETVSCRRFTYVLLHKPKGYVTSLEDPHADKTVMDLVKGACEERIYPVGRLDKNSLGLLLFTNDGTFANLLMHPSHEVEKAYEVLVSGFSPEKLPLLERPIVLDGYCIRPPKVRLLESTGQKARLEVVIHEGRNRQVRRMCQAAGMEVLRLKRTREGSLTLGDLPAGKWRSLTQAEIEKLKK